MQITNNKIEGDTTFSSDTQFHGMVTGTARVPNGVTLNLQGMVSGLVLEAGSTVELHGTVTGNVTNRGGALNIYGTVMGNVVTESGKTQIDPRAKVHGTIHPAT